MDEPNGKPAMGNSTPRLNNQSTNTQRKDKHHNRKTSRKLQHIAKTGPRDHKHEILRNIEFLAFDEPGQLTTQQVLAFDSIYWDIES